MIENVSNTKLIGGISFNRFLWVDIIYKNEKVRVRVLQKREIDEEGNEWFSYNYFKTETNHYDEIDIKDKLLDGDIVKYLKEELNISDYFNDELSGKIDGVFESFTELIVEEKK